MPPTPPRPASLARAAIRRHYPRQEPSAVVLHAGIRAGGSASRLGEALSLPRQTNCLGCSYGFLPGLSPHHALDALAAGIVGKKVNWVLDADFSDYFSSLDHQWLVKFLEHRISDKTGPR